MRLHLMALTAFLLMFATKLCAAVKVTAEHVATGTNFKFKNVPSPSKNDAASTARIRVISGERDSNGGETSKLNDGRIPTEEDQPAENFFFRAGTVGGRIIIDLGSVTSINQINSYSWHGSSRGPQVYKVYGADGQAANFKDTPAKSDNLQSSGWKEIANVDTGAKEGNGGGQHGVSIASENAEPIGKFRYLLFEISTTQDRDSFGNTFYSEIDVVAEDGPEPLLASGGAEKPILKHFSTTDGKYHFTLDSTQAPDLTEWAEKELKPVVLEWYPKIVAMLPSESFEARTNVTLRFRNNMGRTPASAGGGNVNMNPAWFRRELKREARGSVVHELVHIVQDYSRARRTNPNAKRTPGWITEGIPDYIRWFLYEPETKGAEITERNLARAKFDASYRITGNFLDWATKQYDKDLIRKLNAAAREGKYTEEIWKELTGKTINELGDEWRSSHESRLKVKDPQKKE